MKKILLLTTLACLPIVSMLPAAEEEADDSVDYQAEAARVQDHIVLLRSELSAGKAQSLSRLLRLDVDKASNFWPIYKAYEKELYALGDKRFKLIESFAKDYREDTLDDTSAAALSTSWFTLQRESLALLEKYHDQIAKAISPTTAAQFIQFENRFATVIDLELASSIPLIEPASN